MNNKDYDSNTLAKKIEEIERKKNKKKKKSLIIEKHSDEFQLPDIMIEEKAIPHKHNENKVLEQEHAILELEEIEDSKNPIVKDFISSTPSKVSSTEKELTIIDKNDKKNQENKKITENSNEISSKDSATTAQQRLKSIISSKEDTIEDNDNIKFRSMTLEEIRERNFIVKAKKEKIDLKPFFKNILYCLFPAIIAFILIISFDNVYNIVGKNDFNSNIYLILFYFIIFSIITGFKIIYNEYFYRKKSN